MSDESGASLGTAKLAAKIATIILLVTAIATVIVVAA
jgi:hypothetical protein